MQTSFKEPLVRGETPSTPFIVLSGIPFAPQARIYATFGIHISNRRPE
jgi:hypothetical protein